MSHATVIMIGLLDAVGDASRVLEAQVMGSYGISYSMLGPYVAAGVREMGKTSD